MSFELVTDPGLSKAERYELLIPQINLLTEGESNLIANLANITSAIKHSFEEIIWAGFYLRDNKEEDELVLGPFQGRVACIRMPYGKGVCGTAALEKKTIIVDNVDDFPGHIVCDSRSKSEIVVPVIKGGKTVAVLDIDSDRHSNFDQIDRKYLELIIENILHLF
jgi:GAF domain-containing protein